MAAKHTLHYAGVEFGLTDVDRRKLEELYDRAGGTPTLWRFTPTGSSETVAVAVGGGATFYVTSVYEV